MLALADVSMAAARGWACERMALRVPASASCADGACTFRYGAVTGQPVPAATTATAAAVAPAWPLMRAARGVQELPACIAECMHEWLERVEVQHDARAAARGDVALPSSPPKWPALSKPAPGALPPTPAVRGRPLDGWSCAAGSLGSAAPVANR